MKPRTLVSWALTSLYGFSVATAIWIIGQESWTFWAIYGVSYGIALLCGIYFIAEYKEKEMVK